MTLKSVDFREILTGSSQIKLGNPIGYLPTAAGQMGEGASGLKFDLNIALDPI